MKDWFCRTFTPWRAAALFEDGDAWFAYLVRYDKVCNAIRVVLFAGTMVLLILGYAVSDTDNGYSIADLANQPFYLIAVIVLVVALGISVVMIENEKQLPKDMQSK